MLHQRATFVQLNITLGVLSSSIIHSHSHTTEPHADQPQYSIEFSPRENFLSTLKSTIALNILSNGFITSYTRHLELNSLPTPDVLLPPSSHKESQFYSTQAPQITLHKYVTRLVTHARCSPAAFVAALVLLDKAQAKNDYLATNIYNIHRLLTTALFVSCKLVDDRLYSVRHYAAVGGVPSPAELARIELTFLEFVGFRIWIGEEDFERKVSCLQCLYEDMEAGCQCVTVEPLDDQTCEDVSHEQIHADDVTEFTESRTVDSTEENECIQEN